MVDGVEELLFLTVCEDEHGAVLATHIDFAVDEIGRAPGVRLEVFRPLVEESFMAITEGNDGEGIGGGVYNLGMLDPDSRRVVGRVWPGPCRSRSSGCWIRSRGPWRRWT